MLLEQLKFKGFERPSKSVELQILTCLEARGKFSKDCQQVYENLTKGFQGERKFYQLMTENFTNAHCVVLYDLLLKVNQSHFQIDCLLIFQNQIYLLEVKNYEGEFLLKDDGWYRVGSNKKIRSPIQQLDRSNILLNQFLSKMGFSMPIISYVVFVNDSFLLYEAPISLPIIFPAQLAKFILKLNPISTPLNKKHYQLANMLVENHHEQSPFDKIPELDSNELKKGIVCLKCKEFLMRGNNFKLTCPKCNYTENISSGVLRSTIQYHTLFPKEKLTTKTLFEWCGRTVSERGVRKILIKHMSVVGKNKSQHYKFKY